MKWIDTREPERVQKKSSSRDQDESSKSGSPAQVFAHIEGLLGGILVLDLAEGNAGFCAKLLADLGATVIKVERPGGDPLRIRNPKSFFYSNTSKLGVVLSLESPRDMRILRDLLARADVLIETCSPGSPEALHLHPRRLRRLNPQLIQISITPFGRTGPPGFRPRATPPLELPGCHPDYTASLYGAVAVLIRLKKRKITAKGSYLDLSVHEAVASMLEHELSTAGSAAVRNRAEEFSILRSRDGYVQIPLLRNWDTLIEIMAGGEKAGELLDGKWRNPSYRGEHLDEIVAVVEKWTRSYTRSEIVGLGQAMRFPWASLESPDEVPGNPQLRSREFFVYMSPSRALPGVAFPGIPYISGEIRRDPPRPAPILGEHTQCVLEGIPDMPPRKQATPETGSRSTDEKTLKGIRVIDLTRMISGPYATRIFADFGAEVLKIQSGKTSHGAEQNDTTFFSIWNRNKRSVNLDLSLPSERDALLRLVAECDVVIENFSPRVMANWNLDYDRLCSVNSRLVMVSLSAMGQTGPWKDFVGFAPNFHAWSGLLSATYDGKDRPADIGYPYADVVAGLYVALVALAALEYREKAGKGQHVDLSLLEALSTFDSGFSTPGRSRTCTGDLTADDLLTARRFFVRLDHPVLGRVLSARTPLWDWRRKPRWKASPLLGEWGI